MFDTDFCLYEKQNISTNIKTSKTPFLKNQKKKDNAILLFSKG